MSTGGATSLGRGSPYGERREYILRLLREGGQVDVGAVAQALAVSEMTVRRDLARLDSEGLARRVHGGATNRRPDFSNRAGVMPDEKARIARAVVGLIDRGDTVGIDAGTTCRAVARELAHRDDIFAVTNSIQSALEFQHSRSAAMVLGGIITSEASLISNGSAPTQIVHLDKLVLGCGGVSVADGISYFDLAETDVRRRLVDASDTVILAADHSKLGRRKPIVLAALDILDVLVTSAEPPDDLRDALRRASVELVVAPAHA